MENFEEACVPVLARDQRSQSQTSSEQEPWSDAYLSGMPSRNRHAVTDSRLPCTLTKFINECTRMLGQRPVLGEQSQVRAAVTDAVRALVRERAASSRDFDRARFVNTAKLLSQPHS